MDKSATTRLQRIFLRALEMPGSERESWLVKECDNDHSLLQNVRALLAHAEPTVDLLELDLNQAVADLPQCDPGNERIELSGDESSEAVDLDHFLSKLSEVGVLSPDELAAVSELSTDDSQTSDVRQLASELVTSGKLTEYQASALLKGEPELLIDKYLILDLIDVGGMGVVFKAIHRTMNRVVALKVISKQTLSSPEQVRRFQREVRVAATLEHPNAVRSYDADQSRGVHFLVMEYVRGENLHNAVSQSGPFSLERAVDCILQAARGLSYAHRQGIIHRDIKPGNLMMTRDGVVKLLDLGLANVDESLRVLHHGSVAVEQEHGPQPTAAELTAAGMVLGTVSFMSPEQSLDTHLADARSDIYSLGCTFYYLLTGNAPYRGDTIFQVFVQHRDGKIPSLRDTRPDVPQNVATICSKMLAKRPEERHQSMDELIAALEACEIAPPKKSSPKKTRGGPGGKISQSVTVVNDKSTVGGPPSQHATQTRWPRFSKATGLWTGVALVLLVVVFFGAARIWTANEVDRRNDRRLVERPGNAQIATVVESDDQLTQDEIKDESSMSAADLLATGEWEWRVEKKLESPINSPERELSGDMTTDGLTLVFASTRPGGHGRMDLWMATRNSMEEPWSEPTNLGPAINTGATETQPAFSADGLTLLFTRAGKIRQTYFSKRSSSTSPWLQAVPHEINENFQDAPDLTPDGRTLVVTRSIRASNGEYPPGLLISRRTSPQDSWGVPTPVGPPVNTVNKEGGGTLSNDGRLLIFFREEKTDADGFGVPKLWMTTRADWDAPWSEPVLLEALNAVGLNWDPHLVMDGKSLLFTSVTPGTNAVDLYQARLMKKERGEVSTSAADLLATGRWEWRVEKRLDAPINSAAFERGADMTADGLTIVFASNRSGGHGDHDLWMATRASTEAAWSEPTNLGAAINTDVLEIEPILSADGQKLMFTRFGNGVRTLVSTRTSATSPWTPAVAHEINVGHQAAPDLTPDGRTLLVARRTALANGELSPHGLWIGRRSSPQAPWSNFSPIGPPVNTDDHESSGTISNDGRLLIFQRNGPRESENGKMDANLWVTTRPDWKGTWSDPVLLESLDVSWVEAKPRLLQNGKSLLFVSDRPGSQGADIYLAHLVRKSESSSPLHQAGANPPTETLQPGTSTQLIIKRQVRQACPRRGRIVVVELRDRSWPAGILLASAGS